MHSNDQATKIAVLFTSTGVACRSDSATPMSLGGGCSKEVLNEAVDHIAGRCDATVRLGIDTFVSIEAPGVSEHLVVKSGGWYDPAAPEFRERLMAKLVAASKAVWKPEQPPAPAIG